MNRKGFTLIELIAVVALIALLSLVVVPTVINLVNKNKPKLDTATKKLIYNATENFLDYNQTDYPKGKGAVYCISIQTLIEKGFLEENLINIETGEKYDPDWTIQGTYNYKYEYEILKEKKYCGTNNGENIYPNTNKANIIIENLKYYRQDDENTKEEREKIYSSVDGYTIEVPITTSKINDGEILKLNVRKGKTSPVEGFEVSGGEVIDNKTSFTIIVPKTAKVGEYVIEVSGDKLDKVTKNFKIDVNPIILFMGE